MQLKRSEGQGKKLYTGFFLGTVVSVNPTKEELADLIGYELKDDAEDIKYEGKTEKDEDFVSLSFWLKSEAPDSKFFNARFRIVNKALISEKTGKIQYVNQTAGSTWVDDEVNLPDWFTHFQTKEKKNIADKTYRESIQGEANLYTFIRAWLAKVDFFDVDTNVLIDTNRMFRSIDKYVEDEYRPLIKAQNDYLAEQDRDTKASLGKELLVGNVVCLATVYSTDKDGEQKMYQNLYPEYLGAYLHKQVNVALSTNNWMNNDRMKKFYEQIIGEHGCKDAYSLTTLQDFNAADHQQTSDDTFIPEGGTASTTDY